MHLNELNILKLINPRQTMDNYSTIIPVFLTISILIPASFNSVMVGRPADLEWTLLGTEKEIETHKLQVQVKIMYIKEKRTITEMSLQMKYNVSMNGNGRLAPSILSVPLVQDHAQIQTKKCTHKCPRVHTQAYTHARTHTQTCAWTHMHARTQGSRAR